MESGTTDELLLKKLDLVEEKREQAMLRLVTYQQDIARAYNKWVKHRRYMIGELVLKKVLPTKSYRQETWTKLGRIISDHRSGRRRGI